MPKKDIKSVASKQSINSLAQRRKAAMDAAIEGPKMPKKPAKAEKMACGGKVHKMAKGGKATCRGGGAATRGCNYTRVKY